MQVKGQSQPAPCWSRSVGLEGFSVTAIVVTRRLGNMVLTEQAGCTLVTADRKPYNPLWDGDLAEHPTWVEEIGST